MAPRQKPGRSKQDYRTPPEFLTAVKRRLGIDAFDIDLAASAENTVAPLYFDEQMDAFAQESWKIGNGWNWLNPPYADIEPWVRRAYSEAIEAIGEAQTVVLVPASV